MNIYTLQSEQILPVTIETAWEFLSNPANLSVITPPDMQFRITGHDGKPMYPGQIITYTVQGLPMIPMSWVTEITHVQHGAYFVDEQRFGPYSLWHHKHFIEPVEGGVRMTDLVHYALPMGILGRLVHRLWVRKRLETIFRYRHQVLESLFGKSPQTTG